MKTENNKITGYDLTRDWFDFAFENQGKVTGNHGCLYLWLVELNNRMGWAKTFASPASQTMAAVGISSYNTYKKILDDLVSWGFVIMVKPSKNQYTANVIALSKNDKALYKALDKAMIKHYTKHNSSTIQSTDSISKQVNKETNKPKTKKEGEKVSPPTLEDRKISFKNSLDPFLETYGKEMLNKFFRHWTEMNPNGKKMRFEMQTVFEVSKRLVTWKENDLKFSKNGNNQKLKPNGIEPRKNITSYGKL